MLEFKEVFKETGVDLRSSSMIVGSRTSNLVILQDAEGYRLDPKPPKIDVIQVNPTTRNQVFNALILQFKSWGVSDSDAKTYMSVAQTLLSRFPILSVTGKMAGDTTITAKKGSATIPLKVTVLDHLDFDVAFKFVALRDESGNDLGTTEMKPSDADSFIDKLNWIYGLQANVSFRLTEADVAKVQIAGAGTDGLVQSLAKGGPLTGQAFLNFVVDKKSDKADFTVFFVRNYISVDKIGFSETFWSEDACVVIDHPETSIVVPYGYDAFLVNLAHEVAHYLIDTKRGNASKDDHHSRQNILLSSSSQTTRLDKSLVDLINGNSK